MNRSILGFMTLILACGETKTIDVVLATGGEDVAEGSVRFRYEGPSERMGPFEFQGFWDPPGKAFHDWPSSGRCPDMETEDATLECELDMPSGTPSFLFTVRSIRDGFWWGDWSCDPLGGCGAPNGKVTLLGPGGVIAYEYQANQAGAPYYNGYVAPIP